MNKHIQKERTYMKHLKIENQKAFFTRGESWLVVTGMTKEDLLNLAHSAIEEDDFPTTLERKAIYKELTRILDSALELDSFGRCAECAKRQGGE